MTDTTSDADQADGSAIKTHMSERGTWIRLVYMLILGLAWMVAEVVFLAVVVVQFLAKLFTENRSIA